MLGTRYRTTAVPDMSDTLRDQLLGLGFKPIPKAERKPDVRPGGTGQ